MLSVAPEPDELTWTVWPAATRPHAAAAALALVLGVSWYGYAGYGSILYSVIALVVLTASLAFFFFPTTYRLSDAGVEARGFLHGKTLRWDELACYLRSGPHVALSVDAEPTERSLSRGMVLRLEGNEDEVAAYLSRRLPLWQKPSPGDGSGD
jgi:hypothetical protein